eukprot:g69851.t1
MDAYVLEGSCLWGGLACWTELCGAAMDYHLLHPQPTPAARSTTLLGLLGLLLSCGGLLWAVHCTNLLHLHPSPAGPATAASVLPPATRHHTPHSALPALLQRMIQLVVIRDSLVRRPPTRPSLPYWPSKGVNNVAVRAHPPPILLAERLLGRWQQGELLCLVLYGRLGKSLLADRRLIAGATNRVKVDSKLIFPEAWIYGAKPTPQHTPALPDDDGLATITGNPDDIVRGRLVCWSAEQMASRLQALDVAHGLEERHAHQSAVQRGLVWVVRMDGSSQQVLWYFRKSEEPAHSSSQADQQLQDESELSALEELYDAYYTDEDENYTLQNLPVKLPGVGMLEDAAALPQSRRGVEIVDDSEDPRFTCLRCNLTFVSFTDLSRHMSRKHKKYLCPLCPKVYSYSSELSLHLDTHEEQDRPFKCDNCAKRFLTNLDLQDHVRITHLQRVEQQEKEVYYQCDQCEQAFKNPEILQQHVESVHVKEKPFFCPDCNRAFTQPYKLKMHMRTHTGEKPYKCNICAKFFAKSNQLTVHMRTHTGEKPYKCPNCTAAFKTSGQRTTHVKRHHTLVRPYNCSFCSKSFPQVSQLTEHMRTHTGEKPYKCKECPRSFARSGDLAMHMHTHTKPFQCGVCGESFAWKRSLSKHMTTVHKYLEDTPPSVYTCVLCDKGGFVNKHELQQHMAREHQDIEYICTQCQLPFRTKDELTAHSKSHFFQRTFDCYICGKSFLTISDLTDHGMLFHEQAEITSLNKKKRPKIKPDRPFGD